MIQRIGRKRFRIFAYDVESHNDSESLAKNETSIWLSSFIDDESKREDEANYFYTIQSFLDRLEQLSQPKQHHHVRQVNNIVVYDYNLSFEFSFLLPIMLERGFKYKVEINKEDSMVFNSVTNKSCASVWQFQMKFGPKDGMVIFRDLSKIFPSGLANVARSFGLKTQKGEIDYTINRLHGWKVTDEEKEYNFKDTRILIDILEIMQKRNDPDFWKSCSAATYSCRKLLKVAYPHAYKPMKIFRRDDQYPILDDVESAFLRNSVAGGITYAPSRWQFKQINQEISHLDLHQAHPASAFFHLYPYGRGTYYKGNPPHDHFYICCCHVLVSYSGVRLHSVIKLIGTDIATNVELTLWDFEIETMKKAYFDLEVTYIDGYAYRSRFLPWRDYYKQNYLKRMEAKANKDAFNVMYFKLLNNSSYGKFLEHGHSTYFENIINENGVIDSIEKPRDEASLNASFTYLPVGSCIPAYTRCKLVESALKVGWESIVYFDTDSIFFIKTKETDENAKRFLSIGEGLGQWGVEKTIKRGQFAAPKRYKIEEEQDDGTTEDVYHLAGVNFAKLKELPAYDELNVIHGHYTIQGVRRCKGGTLIVWKDKDLGVQPKYAGIYQRNVDNG